MAITTVDGWFAASRQRIRCYKTSSLTAVAGALMDTTQAAGYPTNVASAANAPWTDASIGAPTIADFAVGATGYLAAARFRNSVAGNGEIRDRFAEATMAVAVSAAAGTQTFTPVGVTVPAARVPGGSWVNNATAHLRVSTVIVGGGTITANITYVNQSGVTKSTPSVTVQNTQHAVTEFPLAFGDSGVQSVTSVNIITTAAITTAGTFVIGVNRFLAGFDIRVANAMDAQGWDLTGGIQLFQDSSLWFLVRPDSTSTGLPSWDFTIVSG